MPTKSSQAKATTQKPPKYKEVSEDFYKLAELSIDGILIFDSTQKLCYRNNSSLKYLNLPSQALQLGSSLKDLRNTSNIFEQISNLAFLLKNSKKQSANISIISSGLAIRCIPIADSAFGKGCFEVIIFNASDIINNQRAASKAEKMNALLHFTNNIAHEINNPLAGINNALYLLKSGKLPQEKQSSLLEMVSTNIARISDIVNNLRKYSHQDAVSEECIDVVAAVQTITNKAFETIPHSQIELVYQLSEDKIEILGNPGEFRQMLSNIILNSMQAMTEGGRLEVKVDTIFDVEKRLARIQLTDNGCGMASEEIEYVFNPLYTQKKTWNSIGLGLPVSQRIAQYMHGDIQITSEKGKGTTVTVIIPTI